MGFMSLTGHSVFEATPPIISGGDDVITWVESDHLGYSTFVESATVVDSWQDMSPRRYLYAQTDSAEKPTLERTGWGNGTGQVDFDGNDELFDSVTSEGSSTDPGFTAFFVINADAVAGDNVNLLGASQSSGQLRWKHTDGGSANLTFQEGGEFDSGVGATTGEQVLTCNERDGRAGGADIHWFRNGANLTAGGGNVSTGVPFADDVYIADHPTLEREFAGKYKAIVIVKTAFGGTTTPPTAESVKLQTAIEEYLARRAGITLLAV